MESGGIRQKGRPRKTWWDCVRDDMRIFGLTLEVAQDKVEWRMKTKGANPDLPRNWPLNWCVFVCFLNTYIHVTVTREAEFNELTVEKSILAR